MTKKYLIISLLASALLLGGCLNKNTTKAPTPNEQPTQVSPSNTGAQNQKQEQMQNQIQNEF